MTKKNAVNYLYPYDFTDHAVLLASQSIGTQLSDEAVAALATVTGDDWTKQSTGDFSAVDAIVEYNGPNDLTSRPTNSRFTHVLVLRLGQANDHLSGRMYFHYNA